MVTYREFGPEQYWSSCQQHNQLQRLPAQDLQSVEKPTDDAEMYVSRGNQKFKDKKTHWIQIKQAIQENLNISLKNDEGNELGYQTG